MTRRNKITTIKVPLELSIKLDTLKTNPKESKANVIRRLLGIKGAS